MLLLTLLIACTDPMPVAIQACQAIPTVASTPEGLALFDPLLTAEEHALLAQQQPTLGIQAVGEAGLASLREVATCTASDANHAGPGLWKVYLDREAPSLTLDGKGEVVRHHFEWMVHDTEAGLRVETDLARYVSMRQSIAEGLKTDDHDRATSLWRTMIDDYGDPTLVHDLAAAEAARTHYQYGKKLGTDIMGIDGDELVGKLYNRGKLEIPRVEVRFTLTGPAGEVVVVDAELTKVPAGAEEEVRIDKPDWPRLPKASLVVTEFDLP